MLVVVVVPHEMRCTGSAGGSDHTALACTPSSLRADGASRHQGIKAVYSTCPYGRRLSARRSRETQDCLWCRESPFSWLVGGIELEFSFQVVDSSSWQPSPLHQPQPHPPSAPSSLLRVCLSSRSPVTDVCSRCLRHPPRARHPPPWEELKLRDNLFRELQLLVTPP